MLYQIAMQKIDKGDLTADDFHNIMQGHRNKKSKDMYNKMTSYLLENKHKLISTPTEGEEKKWADNLVNIFYSYATNR